jgi:hypothetical protein
MNTIGIVDVALLAARRRHAAGYREDRDTSLNQLGGERRKAVTVHRPSDSR